MKYLPYVLSFSVLAVAVLMPELVTAQADDRLVPCSGAPGDECGTCELVTLGNNLLNWLIAILFVLFMVLLVAAGFKLVTSGGNQSALDSAKRQLVNALIGIFIVLAAWLIVDTLLKAIMGGDAGPWNSIECTAEVVPTEPGQLTVDPDTGEICLPAPQNACFPEDQVASVTDDEVCVFIPPLNLATECYNIAGGGGLPDDVVSTCQSGDCVRADDFVPCKFESSCSVDDSLLGPLAFMHAAAGVPGARITEAMPPTVNHANACHQNGTCVDYGKAGGMTADEIISVIDAAETAGLNPVWEVRTEGEKQALINAGVPAGNIDAVPWITAPHFSIYGG